MQQRILFRLIPPSLIEKEQIPMMTDQQAAALLQEQDLILILTHIRPDGDTIGCAAGLCALLRQMGKTAYVLPNPGATRHLAPYLAPYLSPSSFAPSFVVSVDMASLSLMPENAVLYQDKVDLAIDHHPSYEGFARNACVDTACAACAELVYRIALACGETVSAEMALPLYMAIATDTGCFQYSNTTSETHRIAGALMDTGIDHQRVNRLHFRTKSPRRMCLEARLISSMLLFDEGTIAVSCVTQAVLDEIGATEDDAEDLADIPGRIEGVEIAVTVREQDGGGAKVSLRTSPSYLNASQVCALFGGGGHAAAAGCALPHSVEQTKDLMLGAIRTILQSAEQDTAGRGLCQTGSLS